MANERAKINTDLGLNQFTGFKPVASMAASTWQKPLDSSEAGMWEALGKLSPIMGKVLAHENEIVKDELRTKEEKLWAKKSAEDKKRLAQMDAKEWEAMDSDFAGDNSWRHVFRNELAGKYRATVSLTEALDARRSELTDSDRTLGEIQSEIDAITSEHRPDDLYGRNMYDAHASQVVQQKTAQYKSIRAKREIKKTEEAFETDASTMMLQTLKDGSSLDPIVLRELMDEYHSVTGESGRDKLLSILADVQTTYTASDEFKDLDDQEGRINLLLESVRSVVDGSQQGKPINNFKGYEGSFPSITNDDGTKSNVLLETHSIDIDGVRRYAVIPSMEGGKSLNDKDKEAFLNNAGPLNDNYPLFNTQEEADAWAKENHAHISEDGSLLKKAQAKNSGDHMSELELMKFENARDEQINNIRRANSEQARQNLIDADLAMGELRGEIFTRIQNGETLESVLEDMKPRFLAIGEEFDVAKYKDDNQFEEELYWKNEINNIANAQGSFSTVREAAISAALSGDYDLDSWQSAFQNQGLSSTDFQNIGKLVGQDVESIVRTELTWAAYQAQYEKSLIENPDLAPLSAKQQWEGYQAYLNNASSRLIVFSGDRDSAASTWEFDYDATVQSLRKEAGDQTPGGEMRKHIDAARSEIEVNEAAVRNAIMSRRDVLDAIKAGANFLGSTQDMFTGQMTQPVRDLYRRALKVIEENKGNGLTQDQMAQKVVDEIMPQVTDEGETSTPPGETSPPPSLTDSQKQVKAFKEEVVRVETNKANKEYRESVVDELGFSTKGRWAINKGMDDSGLNSRIEVHNLHKEISGIDGYEDTPTWKRNKAVQEYNKGVSKVNITLGNPNPDYDISSGREVKPGYGPGEYNLLQENYNHMSDDEVQQMIERGESYSASWAARKDTLGNFMRKELAGRANGSYINGERSYLTVDELKSGDLRLNGRNITLPVPRAALHPADYPMAPDYESVHSWTDAQWMEVYESLDKSVQDNLNNNITAGAAKDIPELMRGLQARLFIETYRVPLGALKEL